MPRKKTCDIMISGLFSNNIMVLQKKKGVCQTPPIEELTVYSKDSLKEKLSEILSKYNVENIYVRKKCLSFSHGFREELIAMTGLQEERVRFLEENKKENKER